jgi:hypothetical protein
MFRNLSRLKRWGIPLTTVITVFFFSVGIAYHRGFWARYRIAPTPSVAELPFTELLQPNRHSLMLVYHVLLGCLGMHAIRRAVAEMLSILRHSTDSPSDELNAKLDDVQKRYFGIRVERLFGTISPVFLIAGFALSFWLEGNVTAWLFLATILVGTIAGAILALLDKLQTITCRIVVLFLLLNVSLVHANFAGSVDATRYRPPLVHVQTASNGSLDCELLVKTSKGLYVRPCTNMPPTLFLPDSEVQFVIQLSLAANMPSFTQGDSPPTLSNHALPNQKRKASVSR